MSRDATGLYSGWAVRLVACPVCGAAKGAACDVAVEGYAEHGVHWDRTESVPAGATEEAASTAVYTTPDGEVRDMAEINKALQEEGRDECLLHFAIEAIDNPRDAAHFALLEKVLAEYGVPENAHVGSPAMVGNRRLQIEWAAAQALEALQLVPDEERRVRMMAIMTVSNVLEALKDGGEWPPKGTSPKPPLGEPPAWLKREQRLEQYRQELADIGGRLERGQARSIRELLELCRELCIENEKLRKGTPT